MLLQRFILVVKIFDILSDEPLSLALFFCRLSRTRAGRSFNSLLFGLSHKFSWDILELFKLEGHLGVCDFD
jgi:hypothetical protein